MKRIFGGYIGTGRGLQKQSTLSPKHVTEFHQKITEWSPGGVSSQNSSGFVYLILLLLRSTLLFTLQIAIAHWKLFNRPACAVQKVRKVELRRINIKVANLKQYISNEIQYLTLRTIKSSRVSSFDSKSFSTSSTYGFSSFTSMIRRRIPSEIDIYCVYNLAPVGFQLNTLIVAYKDLPTFVNRQATGA